MTNENRAAPTLRTTSASRFATNALLFVSTVGHSAQSGQIQMQLEDIRTHVSSPATAGRASRRERFLDLASRWKAETRLLSSATEIAMHPAYQAIIGMGEDALPMILEDLRVNSGHWFWALKAITNEDPVVPGDRGAVRRMKTAWLQWGRAKGLIQE